MAIDLLIYRFSFKGARPGKDLHRRGWAPGGPGPETDAIVAQVPFVDALTSILDPSLPLTASEREE
jgi:hypothetical protein